VLRKGLAHVKPVDSVERKSPRTRRVAEWAAESTCKVILALAESLATAADIADVVSDAARQSAR
jgi:hypothetical protein